MTEACDGSDAEGLWLWKEAYEATEIAQFLFLRKFRAVVSRIHSPKSTLAMLTKVANLVPTHSRRSEESQALQQFSTPIPLAFIASCAAGITADDMILEPSAGTGLMAIFAELAGARLALNEYATIRCSMLGQLFPGVPVSQHDAAHIDDYLDRCIQPTVVLMNPPFSAGVHVEGRVADAAWRHLTSAFARLAPGGRLVAITGSSLSPDNSVWRDDFVRLQGQGTVLFTAAIDGSIYARHGTTMETRLIVIDKMPARDPSKLVTSSGTACDLETLLAWIAGLPTRVLATARNSTGTLSNGLLHADTMRPAASATSHRPAVGGQAGPAAKVGPIPVDDEIIELSYELRDAASKVEASAADGIYEAYRLQSIHIPDAKPHPDKLVESVAMASVAPPKPSYRPHLPTHVVRGGHLSDAQLESVIYAGEAHSGYLAGHWMVDASFDNVRAVAPDTENAVRFRRGWFLGDGTGAGKGRQAAGIILDNWLKGRRRHVWISKSDKLIEDAQRDWCAVGQEKSPALLKATAADLDDGHAAIVQLVSTGAALTERRLAQIPTEEWGDLQVDVTPREYVMDYLMHSFPVQLFEDFANAEGNLSSRPVHDVDGNPVICRETERRRDELVETLGSLPAIPTALDQIVQHFGISKVAEITGRSRRIVRREDSSSIARYAVQNRPGSANLDEARAFMDDEKGILVFSDAGGTGRSYHADLVAQRLRLHNLLEAGWRADVAIQGLGRSHRTNQKQPPRFRMIATNVKAERRFLSTIARRLDTLGAITRGQRQTGGQGMFRSEDNLESQYARDALRQFYGLLHAGRIEGCSLDKFESNTGLSLTSEEGGLKDELPPIQTFLNRMLALTIAMQNVLFEAFEQLLAARIEGAIAAGVYDKGLETITADSMTVTERRLIYTHPVTGAQSHLLTIERRDRNAPMLLHDVLALVRQDPRAKLMINGKSGRPAVMVPTRSIMLDDGSVQPRVSLIRPLDELRFEVRQLEETSWEEADEKVFADAWEAEVAAVPGFSTSTMHIVSGLLLPIWKLLPQDFCRVRRLQTDDGERIVGRVIAPDRLAGLCRNFGIDQTTLIAPDQAWASLVDGSSIVGLAGDMTLRRVRVMNDYRIELTGFTDGMRDWLRSIGLFSEMINWKLRFFVPVTDEGAAVLSKLMQRHRLIDLARRS